MPRSTFYIEGMDCAAEEQLVRMRLEGEPGVERLAFDLPARRLTVVHIGDVGAVRAALESLNLGALEIETVEGDDDDEPRVSDERRPLVWAFAINAALFVGELVAGLVAGSMGLVADALDMLADALVYGLSLGAVGRAPGQKKRVARWSGYLQLGLAVFGLVEVVRRLIGAEEAPDVATMVLVSAVALLGNVVTLIVLRRAPRGEAHVDASWIFTSNDVKVNLLVMAAGGLVWAMASPVPDLVAGALIFLIVANGARRILTLAR
jgi:Co/Zn/Cd efflux system component